MSAELFKEAVTKLTQADPELVNEVFVWLGAADPGLLAQAEANLRYVVGLDKEIPAHLRGEPVAVAAHEVHGTWAIPVTELRDILRAAGNGNGEGS